MLNSQSKRLISTQLRNGKSYPVVTVCGCLGGTLALGYLMKQHARSIGPSVQAKVLDITCTVAVHLQCNASALLYVVLLVYTTLRRIVTRVLCKTCVVCVLVG